MRIIADDRSMLVPLLERRFLRRRSLLLVLRLPLVIGHAVHGLAALVLGERDAFRVGGFLHPVAETVAAEACEIHQVDVLHVGAERRWSTRRRNTAASSSVWVLGSRAMR